MDVERIAQRLWPESDVAVEVLGGGITNRNFKVTADGESFVLRIGGKDTELLGIDRHAEYEASQVAAGLGVAPEVVGFLEPEGFLVTRFVEGAPVSPEELRRPERLRELGTLLRRIHDGPAIGSRFDSFRVVEQYCATALAHGVSVPPSFHTARTLAAEIERARGEQPLRTCHNDLLSANLIRAGSRIVIVDWEYAGMGDPFFDLANLAANNGLDEDESRELLLGYAGEAQAEELDALVVMRFMSDFREAMWGVVQQGISELDFDFAGYAAHHFDRLAATAADPGFRGALDRITQVR